MFIILGIFYFPKVTQTKPVELIEMEPNELNFFDKFRLHNNTRNEVSEQIFKADKRLGNSRIHMIKSEILNQLQLQDRFDDISELIKNNRDSNEQVKIYRGYERLCLEFWEEHGFEIEPMNDIQIKYELTRLKTMKQSNQSLSKSKFYQNIFDRNCIVPLGWFYHWDLINEY